MKYRFTLLCITLLAISATTFAQIIKINTIAGLGSIGFSGDGGVATNSELHGPGSVAVDGVGNVYFVDFFNFRVRKINTAGIISTIAGVGLPGYWGDGSIGTSAQINPHSVTVNKKGDVYISDAPSGVIRKVNSLGIISTVAGTGLLGNTGNGGLATAATLNRPHGMAFDADGNLYVADAANNQVRKIDTFGIITLFAGDGTPGFAGDGGPATAAKLDSPYAVAVDTGGNVFIADYMNNVIRKVDKAGTMSTYAGNTFLDYTGDGGSASLASGRRPVALATDTLGNLFVADVYNHVIRKINAARIITTVAGNGTLGFSGDLGPANGANLYAPAGIAVDKNGDLYIGDANNQRVRKTYRSNVGVAEVRGNNSIKAYPNPAGNTITLEGVSKSDLVVVYDIAGRQVSMLQVSNDNTQRVDLSELSKGVYTISVLTSTASPVGYIELVKE